MSVLADASVLKGRGKRLLPWALVVGLIGFTQWETVSSVWRTWQSDAYGHGPLVALISLWLLIRAAPRIAWAQAGSSRWGVAALLAVLGAWFLANLMQVQAVQQVCLFLALAASTWALLGPVVARPLLFPLLLPLISVSIWDQTLGGLQELTVRLVSLAISMTDIPAYIDGKYIRIPEGIFVIETVCAGLRYFLAGMTLSLLYCNLYLQTWTSRLALVGITAAWMVLLNAVRVMIVIVMGHWWGMDHPWVEDHGDAGWVVFAIGLMPLLFAASAIERREGRHTRAPGADTGAGSAEPARGSLPPWTVAGLLAATIVALGYAEHLADTRELPLHEVRVANAERCAPSHLERAGWEPRFAGATRELCWVLPTASGEVTTYAAQYSVEQDGSKLIFYGNRVHDPDAGRLIGRRTFESASGLPLREIVQTREHGRARLIWFHYRVGRYPTTSGVVAKLLRLPALAFGSAGGSVLALSMTVPEDRLEAGRESLADALAKVSIDVP